MRIPIPTSLPKFRKGNRIGFVVFLAIASGWIASCQNNEVQNENVLVFNNPNVADSLDSLKVCGVVPSGDSIAIYRWRKGEEFASEVKYPSDLKQEFVLVVRGYKNGSLVYQSSSEIVDGSAKPSRQDYKVSPPDLMEGPVTLISRLKDSLTLNPTWKSRPGIYRQVGTDSSLVFTPQAENRWMKGGVEIGKDSILRFDTLRVSDSGNYVFISSNAGGRDSATFRISLKHLLPRINPLGDQIGSEGKPFSLKATVEHSDTLLYRWIRGTEIISTDSVLKISTMQTLHSGGYQLIVKNASDTTEIATSNLFQLGLNKFPRVWGEIIWNQSVWQ